MGKIDPIYGRDSHTPGPWEHLKMRIGPNEKDRRCGIVINGPEPKPKNELPVRICDMRTGDKSYSEMQCNARLIAAAPDLLKFAQGIEAAIQATGHNLNSTATREERSRFISNILDAWNNGGYAAIDKATE